MILFNGILLKLEGNTGVAAYGVIANLSLVTAAVYTGIAQGVQPLVSTLYGRREKKQIKKMLRYAMTAMFAASCLIYLLIFIFAQPVTAVFNSENNPEFQRIAVVGLKLYFLSSACTGYNIILAIFFPCVDRALPAHILSVLRGFVLIIPMAFFLSAVWGMTGVWLACPAAEAITALYGCCKAKKYIL